MTTISEFVKVDITDQMKVDADRLGNIIYKAATNDGMKPVFTVKDIIAAHGLGFLGEIAFSYYRYGNWDKIADRTIGHTIPYDDTIDGKTIEVKTGNRIVDIAKISSNFYFMIPYQQVTHRPDYYVQILVHNGSAYITGYITLEEVLRVGVTGSGQINPSFNVPISKLRPIGSLINPIGLARWAK